jgi:hypothetical protein
MADHLMRISLVLGPLFALVACAGNPPAPKPPVSAANSMPPGLMRKQDPAATPASLPPVELTAEDDIVFTDPDNPDASLPELSTLLAAAPRRRGPWEQSESIAKRLAVREGKPLLIWFTDSSGRSPMCKAISEELFKKPEFEEWASEKIIRLRVDANVVLEDEDLTLGEKETKLIERERYVNRLKKQYKVLGQPVVVMLNPAGEKIGQYRGYKRGDADFTWGLIKQAEVASTHATKSWRASLEQKGYREWSDVQDRNVFAKLVRYSEGTLTLIEPDGTRSRTHENRLSEKDRAWIAEQKRLRGL